MLFNSFEFFLFFPIVTLMYFLLPQRLRWFLLLSASCLFYMAFVPAYILILLVTIVIDYIAGIWIERTSTGTKKVILWVSIISTCLVLFIFKYFNFFNTNLTALAEFIGWNYSLESLKLVLPIGLSFHTFQSLSYVIEVYYGRQKAEHHFGIYSLYVMFYPQLVAGPIERPQNLLHQFREVHHFDYDRVVNGLKLMAWGLFKKMVIADRLAIYVDAVYKNPSDYHGAPLILATYFFAFQVYCDFSGYSDIAIGSARVMGFELMTNFRRPYFAKSIGEFWQRWHISLSTWFRDYVYIPLGGNRVAKWRWYGNLFITFLISGLWHGANWTFVIWGALHGLYYICSMATQGWRLKFTAMIGLTRHKNIHKFIKVFITFHLVLFSWIFFRANSLSDALTIIHHMTVIDLSELNINVALGRHGLLIGLLAIICMEIYHLHERQQDVFKLVSRQPAWIRWPAYYVFVASILVLGVFGSREFIYFQF